MQDANSSSLCDCIKKNKQKQTSKQNKGDETFVNCKSSKINLSQFLRHMELVWSFHHEGFIMQREGNSEEKQI